MASILRQIVAGPRARHPEAGLDLCYVTDNIVVTSGPSSVWPKKAYRNPTDQLVAFLDKKHAQDWSIFEFRAEGTGYPDSEVYNRIHHFPWPDHHPPPFAIVPNMMAAMRNWIQRLDTPDTDTDTDKPENGKKRIAVVHCKAGKGRSGTVACSYLISEEGWKMEDALQRFTSRRMRAGFGQGVSIPSQLRWVRYVDQWTNKEQKRYVESPVEIVEVHVWGLRDGVKVAVEGFVDHGRRIQHFHTFVREEKTVMEEGTEETHQRPLPSKDVDNDNEIITSPTDSLPHASSLNRSSTFLGTVQTVILRPASPLILPTSDINIDFERRNKASYTGFTMVTSIAHVWFNAFFEGGHAGHDSGVFEIEWDAMDGIKGSARKGIKALDRLKVVWKYSDQHGDGTVITEPKQGEPVPEGEAADWKSKDDSEGEAQAKHSDGVTSGRAGGAAITMGAMINQGASTISKELGLRKEDPESANISRASSVVREEPATPHPKLNTAIDQTSQENKDEEDEGVKTHIPGEDDPMSPISPASMDSPALHSSPTNEVERRQDTRTGHVMESGMAKFAHMVSKVKGEHHEGTQAKSPT